MAGKVAFASEGSAAEQTNERPLSGMFPDVEFQVLFTSDAFAAKRTGESAFALSFCRIGP